MSIELHPRAIGLSFSFRIGSVCMTICVNIERMFAIVYPLRTAAWRKHMVRSFNSLLIHLFTRFC